MHDIMSSNDALYNVLVLFLEWNIICKKIRKREEWYYGIIFLRLTKYIFFACSNFFSSRNIKDVCLELYMWKFDISGLSQNTCVQIYSEKNLKYLNITDTHFKPCGSTFIFCDVNISRFPDWLKIRSKTLQSEYNK